MYQTPKKPHFVGPGLGNRCGRSSLQLQTTFTNPVSRGAWGAPATAPGSTAHNTYILQHLEDVEARHDRLLSRLQGMAQTEPHAALRILRMVGGVRRFQHLIMQTLPRSVCNFSLQRRDEAIRVTLERILHLAPSTTIHHLSLSLSVCLSLMTAVATSEQLQLKTMVFLLCQALR